MSVYLEDFCKEAESELAKKLAELVDEVVLIGSDTLDITTTQSDMVCRILVQHTISCNDIEIMQRVLAGHYWRFTSALGSTGFELWIDFKPDVIE